METWTPEYLIKIPAREGPGEKTIKAPVQGAKQEECPVSIISRHRDMDSLVVEVFNMYRVKESTGAILFGLDTSKWPARWYDAIRIAEIEEGRVDEARDECREAYR